MFLESSKPSDEDITSYIEAEGLQNWRSSALVTMHIESGKVERKYVTFDPVTWYHLVLGGGDHWRFSAWWTWSRKCQSL